MSNPYIASTVYMPRSKYLEYFEYDGNGLYLNTERDTSWSNKSLDFMENEGKGRMGGRIWRLLYGYECFVGQISCG